MTTFKKASYRQRVYQMVDGSINLVYGDVPAPFNPDGSLQHLLADHDVTEEITVSDHGTGQSSTS